MYRRLLPALAILLFQLSSFTNLDAIASTVAANKLCNSAKVGFASCMAVTQSGPSGRPLIRATPSGYSPTQIRSAYGLTLTGRTTTIGIVAAYDNPNITTQLTTYSQVYGLPAANFQQFNQRGGTSYPATNAGWATEISLDVETVHGICPSCRIILVEADSPSLGDLTTAVDRAVTIGATIVSNSYGGPEYASETSSDGHYSRSGITMVASSGDSGYGTSYPAVVPGVIAVGGTTLVIGSSETAWNKAGSGCSRYEPKPIWQHDSACARRSIADISADADPTTGAAIYSSFNGQTGWLTVGGTSLAAPIVAGAIGLAGGNLTPGQLYSRAYLLHDITSGKNGTCKSVLCIASTGYDGPTGLGTIRGLAAL